MNTLMVHQADLGSVAVFCDWLESQPDTFRVHKLSLFYRQEPSDIEYIIRQIRRAIEFYSVNKVVFFNFDMLHLQDLFKVLQREFPALELSHKKL